MGVLVKKYALAAILLFLMAGGPVACDLFSNEPEELSYHVWGTASDVTITYAMHDPETDHREFKTVHVTRLPWNITLMVPVDDETDFSASISADNNSGDNKTVLVSIEANGGVRAADDAAGPYCNAYTTYEVNSGGYLL